MSLMLEYHSSRERSFKLLAGWIEHPSFSDFVKKNWNVSAGISSLYYKFTDQIKRWNKEVYGHISTHKKILSCRLENIKIECDRTNFAYLKQVEMKVREKLKNVLHHEDVLWRQKVRCDWLVLGDRNTKFLYTRALRRRKHNGITSFKIDLGEWIMDD